jgi:RNA polymerase sigma-70 factor (ECF subfamily)
VGAIVIVRSESEQSFAELFAPLIQPAYRLACAMLHDASAAEDVVQEASLIAWRKLRKLDDRSRLRPWFLGIVANECRNARRRAWSRRVATGLPGRLAVISGEDRTVAREDMRRALMKLDHDDRLIISLYFYLDLLVAEIAPVIGTTEAAARARLYRAIRRLRPDLAIEEALR